VTSGGAVGELVAATGVGEAVDTAPEGPAPEPVQAESTNAAPATGISLVLAKPLRRAGTTPDRFSIIGSAYPRCDDEQTDATKDSI